MKIKTSELTGVALDYAVAVCEGAICFRYDTVSTYWMVLNGEDIALKGGWAQSFTPSSKWAQGGPLIERERIDVAYSGDGWYAVKHNSLDGVPGYIGDTVIADDDGPTPLIAAMRCYVASKLGGEVEIPDELG